MRRALIAFSFLTMAGCGGTERVCQEGASGCAGTVLVRCQGNTWRVEADCALSEKECVLVAEGAECRAQGVCQDGEQRCSGQLFEQCISGAWQMVEDCAASGKTCREGPQSKTAACESLPDCDAGQSRCRGELIETCSGGVWQPSADCALEGKICSAQGGAAVCTVPPCAEGRLRCQGDILQRCSQGQWIDHEDCAASLGWCVEGVPDASCARLEWRHLEIEINDPVVQGSSLFLPIDGPSFGYSAALGLFATAFGHEYESPYQAHLWLVEEASGMHRKILLSGAPLAVGTNFCGDEDWCQFISFDPLAAQWVVVGPSAPALMRIRPDGVTVQTATGGTRQPDSYIDRIHCFDWPARRLWLYGALGPSSLSTALYALDLDSGAWSRTASGLRPVFANCLVVDSSGGRVWSFAGRTSSDGGNTTELLGSYDIFAPDGSGVQTLTLPAAIGPREGMACALDGDRGLIYLFGGAVVRDRYDEAQNDYHNDLWALRLSDGAWIELVAESPGGTLGEPDQHGDRKFTGFPEGPNFGQNRGYMIYDQVSDRLLIAGEVPIFTHGQLYVMDLAGVEKILDRSP